MRTARPLLSRRAPRSARCATPAAAAVVVVLSLATGCTTSTTPPSGPGATAASSSTVSTPAPSAAQILEQAKRNAVGATSGAFSGHVEQSGATMVIGFKGTSDGTKSDVTIEREAQGKVRVISIGQEVYLRGDAAFWKTQGLPAPRGGVDRFVRTPSAPEIAKRLSLNTFLDAAFAAVTTDQVADRVESQLVDGVDTWVISDARGRSEGALYIAKDSLQVVRFTGSSDTPAQLDFSHWNVDPGITPPLAGELSTLS